MLEKHEYDSNIRLLLCLFSNLNNPRVNQRISRYTNTRLTNVYNFNSNDEELMFYMFIIDPDLRLLKINSEEDNIADIKKRYHSEFGIELDTRLLTLEKIYDKKYLTMIDEMRLVRTKKDLD